jgi:polysaccharide pyruvyl transferase WcaK-like protein
MQSLDMLLVSGSGQVDDYWGGPWAQPFRLMAWSMAARSQGKPVAVFGVGVDELSTRLGAWFSVRALNCAQLCVLRDTGSRDAIRDMGFSGQMDVCADPAFSIVAVPSEIDKSPATPYAVISPISRRAWPGAEDEAYSAYLTALAAAADFLQNQSVQVRFVCSQTSMDPRIVDRIKQRMQGDPLAAIAVGVKTFEEYLTAVQGARVVIGSRLHALILALVAGTPVIAVSGVRKVHQLFADLDLSDHAFDIRSLHIAPLLGRIETVIRDHVAMKEHVRNKTREFRPQLDTHFDKLARLIPSSPGGC